MDVIIAYLIHINMVQQTSTMTTHAVTMAAQKKTRSYVEQTLGDDFIPLLLKHIGVFIIILIHS
jgi:hypothetical protein